MPTKIQIYKVNAPFTHEEINYKPGDEFAMPPGWLIDEEYTEMVKRLTFKKPYQESYFEDGEKKTDTFYRRVLLPVVANA